MTLSSDERERFRRQIGPGVFSESAQESLRGARVLISRVGGMGGPAAQMLAMAGVGHLILAHGGDLISPDLNRQVLGSEAGLGTPRAPQFASYLKSLSRFVEVEALAYEPDDEQADELASRVDVVIACPPSFEERLRLNRAAVRAGKPFIDAAQWGMNGSLFVGGPGDLPCLECLYPEPPPFEEFFPVVGAISSAIGSLAALEALKILTECGRPMWGRMLMYDGYQADSSWVTIPRRPDCATCGDERSADS